MLYELNITISEDIKVLIRSYLRENRISYSKFAKQLNVSKSAIGNILSERMDITPTLEHTVRLLDAIGYELVARRKT